MRGRYHTILCPTDLSDASGEALPIAYRLVEDGGTVHLLHVVVPGAEVEEGAVTEEDARRRLRHLETEEGSGGIQTRGHVLSGGDVPAAIEVAARRHRADVVVMATRGRTGVRRVLLGSVAADVVRKTGLPVILVRSVPGTSPTDSPTEAP
jgi:nucleotide-binding universal stress UspA family protein